MLDRKTIKSNVKGILGGESKGSAFLAMLLVFAIVLVYFGGVWALAQFNPVTRADFEAVEKILTQNAGRLADVRAVDALNGIMQALPAISKLWRNIGLAYLWAVLLEMIIILPLATGVNKFMLRVIRLKNPGAGTVFKGYSGPYFFRSILLPIWQGICMLGWQLILLILLCGMMAGTALATGLSASDFIAAGSGNIAQGLNGINAAYISKYGWAYLAALGLWSILAAWLTLFKVISYSLSGVALSERPQMGVRKAVRASRRILRGNHFKMCMVALSYIGWYLLAALAFALVGALGVGLNMLSMGQLGLIITLAVLFVVSVLVIYLLVPYRAGVQAMCYVQLKREALENGVVCKEDFRGKRELSRAND